MSQNPVPPASDPSAFVYVPPLPPPGAPLGPPLPKPPVWPLVIGIISTTLGALGLAGIIFGLIMLAVMKPFLAMVSQQPGAPQVALGPDWPWAVPSYGAQILTATLLLIAGIALIRRRRAAKALHMVYVVLEVGLILISATMMIVGMQEAARAVATMPATTGPAVQAAAMTKMGMVFGGVSGGFGLAMGMAYPTFLLVWFLRKRINDDMRAWGQRRP